MLISRNPYTEEINQEFELLESVQLQAIIYDAHKAFLEWRKTDFAERKRLFLGLAQLLEDDCDECARLQTLEMGMLFADSKAGLLNTVALIRWFANNLENILGDEYFDQEGMKGKYIYDSLGVIFGIAPWNFPFNQLLRAAVPNILAGNTMLYKHASNVPLCAQKIQNLFDKAGFSQGIYTNVFVSSSLSEEIISHPFIVGVNLTGSEKAGQSVGSLAGKYLKPSVLELGGNDAFVVCDTKNIDRVVSDAVKGRMRNGGQACNASKRFIVCEKYYDEFCSQFAHKMGMLKHGDPMNSDTQVQPLSSLGAMNEVDEQVQKAIHSGAELLVGGKRIEARGYFYAPTVLVGVTPEVSSFHEEIFGPVASVIKSSSLEESIALANNSEFGLSACVYGDDIAQLEYVARQLKGGMIFMNSTASSKAFLPFGGVGKSGYGKENGEEGFKAFTNKKVVLNSPLEVIQ